MPLSCCCSVMLGMVDICSMCWHACGQSKGSIEPLPSFCLKGRVSRKHERIHLLEVSVLLLASLHSFCFFSPDSQTQQNFHKKNLLFVYTHFLHYNFLLPPNKKNEPWSLINGREMAHVLVHSGQLKLLLSSLF